MDYLLYETKLANHKIFKDVKESLSESSCAKLRNLMELKDDVLYIWNSIDNCLFSVNVKHLDEHEEETPYQKLHLLCPPAFSVERLMSSECGSRLCLWGTRGVTIAELPSRWGRGGLFDSGSQTILCKSQCLDERFLYSQGEIYRVHWHPRSLSHVLVLVSDNTMRLYNIAIKSGPKLVKIFAIGPKPSGALGRTVLDSLGDTAVDFTTAPDSEHLLILSGSGDVYMMQCQLDGKSPLHPKIKGPLSMYPPADDNYGSESCSIIALGGLDTPVIVVIASASAALYHCLLLPDSTDKEDGDGYALYVVESVELNISVGPNGTDMQYVYPVHLYPCTRNTYACVHAGGVHSVTLPILEHLREYALADEGDTESILSAICRRPSAARHLVCTGGAPAGLAATGGPRRHLLLLCPTGELLPRALEPYELDEQLYQALQLINPALDQDDIDSILKERQKLSFTAIVQDILAREVSQPILRLDVKEEPTPKECLELLTEATVRLRTEYIGRQQRTAEVLVRKVSTLCGLSCQQEDWIKDLQAEIKSVHLQSEVLKEKRARAEKNQEDMKYRCSAAMRTLRAQSGSSAEERRALAELRGFAERVRALQQDLLRVRTHAARRSHELQQWREEYKKKDSVLGRSHSDTISSVLQQQTAQITTLVEETKLLKDQLGVV